jgi:hypothetical protein
MAQKTNICLPILLGLLICGSNIAIGTDTNSHASLDIMSSDGNDLSSRKHSQEDHSSMVLASSRRKLTALQAQYKLRGATPPSPILASSTSNAEESLKLLQQMEQLKLQLEALVGKNQGSTIPSLAQQQQQQQVYSPPQQMSSQYRIPDRASQTRSASLGGKCGGGDAFAGQPVDGWNPPSQARLEDIQQWEDARREVTSLITHFNRGGKPLRELIHKEVSALKLLRQKLFCQYM